MKKEIEICKNCEIGGCDGKYNANGDLCECDCHIPKTCEICGIEGNLVNTSSGLLCWDCLENKSSPPTTE